MTLGAVTFAFILCLLLSNSFPIRKNVHNPFIFKNLGARAAKVEEKADSAVKDDNLRGDGSINIPFNGVVGMDTKNLYERPLNMYDPTQELLDVPGEDGSPEQIAAIQRKLQERIEKLKANSQWEENNEEFGQDPLSKTPFLSAAVSMLKVSKPYDSVDEFALTFAIVIASSALLMLYVTALGTGLDKFIDWFEKADFDISNFDLSSLFN